MVDKKTALFLFSASISFLFFLGINLLQNNVGFLANKKTEKYSTAQINFLPTNQTAISEASSTSTEPICQIGKISAESFLFAQVNKQGIARTLLEKNSQNKMPQASITKLMTYLVAKEFYKNDEEIKISKEAVKQPEDLGNLSEGEILQVKELLPIMLIESSNDAAFALTKLTSENGFVALMNLKAKDLGLDSTFFYNPTGIDPEALNKPSEQINYSTSWDITKLTQHLIFNSPDFLSIVSQKEYPLVVNAKLHHVLKNTNELLDKISGIIGGKTGTTDRAGQCLMIILNAKAPDNYYVAVILNSKQRFEDMQEIIRCAKQ